MPISGSAQVLSTRGGLTRVHRRILVFVMVLVSWSAIAPAGAMPAHEATRVVVQRPTNQGRFQVAYLDAKKPLYREMQKTFQEGRLLETIAEALNEAYRLPRDVTLALGELDTPNAFYHPEAHAIVISYELIEYYVRLFQQISPDDIVENTTGAIIFALFHELGHCLIAELDLPATGREEDAVDDFATLLLIEDKESGEKSVLAASMWFAAKAESKAGNTPFWDEHSLDMQRFYGILALMYGSNPQRYERLCRKMGMPEQRLALAREEFTRKQKAWARLLEPYRVP